ncbi:MAG: hypothetical protein AAFO79_01720 [Pseudomonadota bacterium]
MSSRIDFSTGQTWHYNTRDHEECSRLQILRVDQEPDGQIIHVRVTNLQMDNPFSDEGVAAEVGHLPIEADALAESVTHLADMQPPLGEGFNGYENWRDAFDEGEAGVFCVSVAEVLEMVEEATKQAATEIDQVEQLI